MTYELNFAGIADKKQLHRFLAEKLEFPHWYGHNLDALMDCLTDLGPTRIILKNWQTLSWAEPFWNVLRQAQQENPDLQVEFSRRIYLFDFDGTLVDSMPTFISAMLRILDENGICYGSDIVKTITPLGLMGTADYYINVLGVKLGKEQLIQKMGAYMLDAYAHTIPAKSHVEAALRALKSRGESLNVLTASPHASLDVCLQRLGLWELFDNIWSCDDFATTKADPHIYEMAAQRLGTTVENVLFLDDNLDADTTAKKAGMQVCGVYDESSRDYIQQIKDVADFYIYDFSELPDL